MVHLEESSVGRIAAILENAMTRTTGIWLLCLAHCLLACGGGDREGRDDRGDDGGEQDGGGAGAGFDPGPVAADLAALLCEASSQCECAMEATDASACIDAVAPELARRVGQGDALGLRYHEECLSFATAHSVALSCRRFGETRADGDDMLAAVEWEARRCKPLAGDGGRGDACSTLRSFAFLALGDTCAQGLTCADSRCVELLEATGDTCARDDAGVGLSICPPGTRCADPDADGVVTCERRPSAGEPCDPYAFGCEGELRCDPDRLVCTELPGPGQACLEGECAAGNVCVKEMCQVLPGDGEPCWGLACAAGLRCANEDGINICRPLVGEGEPCSYPEDCSEGLTCSEFVADGVCVNLPGEGEGCFGGSYCASGLECAFDNTCVRPPPMSCLLPFCVHRSDGLCDEPEGSSLCPEGTDPEDCRAGQP